MVTYEREFHLRKQYQIQLICFVWPTLLPRVKVKHNEKENKEKKRKFLKSTCTLYQYVFYTIFGSTIIIIPVCSKLDQLVLFCFFKRGLNVNLNEI